MAAKKTQKKRPSIANAPKRRRATAPAVTEKTLGQSIIEQLQIANSFLGALSRAMQERNGMLSTVTGPDDSWPVIVKDPTSPAEKVAALVGQLPAATPEQVGAALGGTTKKKRGRPSKAELQARADAAVTPPAPGSTTLEKAEEQEPTTSLPIPEICPCGVRVDLPAHLHSKLCPVHGKPETAPEEKPAGPPSLDEIRGVAIAFIGKHGRDALTTLLAKYQADKLTSVTEAQRTALMVELQAGVA